MKQKEAALKAIEAQPVKLKGRPSAKQSKALDEKIKTVALDLFLEHGFDAVTMEMIAEAAGITRKTLYKRYKDKSELFLDVLEKAQKAWNFNEYLTDQPDGRSLRDDLKLIAQAMLDQVLDKNIISLSRIAAAQAEYNPQKIAYSYVLSGSPRIQSIISTLEQHKDDIKESYLENPQAVAELFLAMITGLPARLASFGNIRDTDIESDRIEIALDIFINGIKK